LILADWCLFTAARVERLGLLRFRQPGLIRAGLCFIAILGLLRFASAQDSRPAESKQSESRPTDTTGVLEMALELARRDQPKLDAAAAEAEVAKLAARVRAIINATNTAGDANPKNDAVSNAAGAGKAPAAIDALRIALFDEAKFESAAALTSPELLHVDSVLRDRRGYCLSLSIVALAVAERAGIPLRGVGMPNHFFVRFDDGKIRRNFELTRAGAEVTDAEFRERMGSAWREDSVYLKNLTTQQIRAFLLHNRGFVAMAQGKRAEAAADFREALKLMPDLPETHRNLGVLLGEDGKFAEARAEFDRALQLFANDADALVNRALCQQKLGDLAAALADLEVAYLLDPRDNIKNRRDALRVEVREHDWESWQKIAVAPLDRPPVGAGRALEPGLETRFYNGMNFEKEVAASRRIDREVDFDWKSAAPARGVPADRFSTRIEGWFRAEKAGKYSFFIVANDGARLVLDEKTMMESWEDQGRDNWYGAGDVALAAGWHRIKIEHYDSWGGARLLLRIGVEGQEKPLRQQDCFFHEGKAEK
jgi:regulator of sirC expression with transglutaminase-like and TPR domain